MHTCLVTCAQLLRSFSHQPRELQGLSSDCPPAHSTPSSQPHTTLCHVGDRSSTHNPRSTSRFPLLPVYSVSYLTTFPHHRRHLQPPHRRVKHNPKPSLLLERLWAFFPSVILFHPWSPSPTLQYLPRPDNQSLPRGLAPQSRRGPTFTAFPSSTIRCHLLSASDPSHAAVPSIVNFHHLLIKATPFLLPSLFHHHLPSNLPTIIGLGIRTPLCVFSTTTHSPSRASSPCSSPATHTQPSHLVSQLPLLFFPSFHHLSSKRLCVLPLIRTAITDAAIRRSRTLCQRLRLLVTRPLALHLARRSHYRLRVPLLHKHRATAR